MATRLGIQVVVRRRTSIDFDRDTIERSRDITIVKLRREGQSWRQIGAFLGLSHEQARKRWFGLDPEIREELARGPLAALAIA